MDHSPGGAERAGRRGSLIEGIVVGLALELGAASALALAASQVRRLDWSPPIAPLGLLLVAAFAFAMVVGIYLESADRPSPPIGLRATGRRGGGRSPSR